jgi:hypothetical protein
MSTGQGQGRLTESRQMLSQTDAITALSTFYGSTAKDKTVSPARKKANKNGTATLGANLDDAIDLSDSESVSNGGEVLASVLGLPSRVMYVISAYTLPT